MKKKNEKLKLEPSTQSSSSKLIFIVTLSEIIKKQR